MRQTLSKGMVVAAAATGMLSLYGGSTALADSQAQGTAQGSAGVLSGNSIQAPVNVPVNVCGNSVDAAAALNPAFGNSCGNTHDSQSTGISPSRVSQGSHDQDSRGDSGGRADHDLPPSHGGDQVTPPLHGEDESAPSGFGDDETASLSTLAHTGGNEPALIATSAAGAAMIAAGTILYRRGRSASRR
ncbi:chaplin [Streptomyces sp. NPDC052301]|uniref:chaplin n=1 Tax=Streptomyces sp. NPDC052301 TaxID=3365687 RepID=UPI0037D24B77